MNDEPRRSRISVSVALLAGVALVAVLVLAYVGMRRGSTPLGVQDYLGNLMRKTELLSRMRVNLGRSEEAEKSAVMADTDEASKDFADRSRRAADLVEQDRQELERVLEKDSTDEEEKLYRDFAASWSTLRETDREVLEFAVQNTNLKAAALSFGRGWEDIRRFRGALEKLIHPGPGSLAAGPIVTAATDALIAGLTIQSLHAPHIADASAERMDEIEEEMRRAAQTIDVSLERLAGLVSASERPVLQEANAAYDDYATVTAEVVRLSRQNTNVKSFALSLGRKRKLAAECDQILASLDEAVRKKEFKATR